MKKDSDKHYYFTRLANLTPREAALAMFDIEYDTEDMNLTDEQLERVNKLKRAITRNLQAIVSRAASNANYPAHYVLSAAYVFQKDGETPNDVKKVIFSSISKLMDEKGWEDKLKKIGGDELYLVGKGIRHQKRGMHKRDDEDRYNLKLIGLLIELLQKYGKTNYKDLSAIHRDLALLCEAKGVSYDGIKKSTFYSKIKEARDIIEFE